MPEGLRRSLGGLRLAMPLPGDGRAAVVSVQVGCTGSGIARWRPLRLRPSPSPPVAWRRQATETCPSPAVPAGPRSACLCLAPLEPTASHRTLPPPTQQHSIACACTLPRTPTPPSPPPAPGHYFRLATRAPTWLDAQRVAPVHIQAASPVRLDHHVTQGHPAGGAAAATAVAVAAGGPRGAGGRGQDVHHDAVGYVQVQGPGGLRGGDGAAALRCRVVWECGCAAAGGSRRCSGVGTGAGVRRT